MKIIFKDGISVFNRPDVEREFNSTEELFNLLDEFGGYKYAYTAIIYDGSISIPLMLDSYGNWSLDLYAAKAAKNDIKIGRKFSLNDKVTISSDKKQDYGLLFGKTGIVSTLGKKTRGSFTYLVDFGCNRIVRVFEDDLSVSK